MSFLTALFGRKKKKEDIPISRLPEETKAELPVPRGNIPITQQEKESKTELRVLEESTLPSDTPLTLPKEPVRKETLLWKTGDVILDHYDVEDVITSGGMGTVYITNHKNWKVKVAIKSPNKEMLDHPSFFQMVVKEAEAWTDLGLHPNIAYCYFVRNIDNIPHIFVEYVDGGNLREWIEEGWCNDLKTGLDLAIQFCHGMAYAHSKGMIHKDIKPGNILMTKDGILKITDFGLVQRGTDQGASPILYTEPYASPEQMSDAPIVGPESDVYSFGICLWEMFLGRRPRPNAWNNNPIPDPKTIDSSLPDALACLLAKMVDLDRNTRIALGGFDALKEQFKTIYQNLFHEPSAHSELEQVDLKADGLNNRAISYLELGKEEEAIRAWEEALKADPHHLESTFNYGYHRWNKGQPYRDVLEIPMTGLETSHSSNPDYWLCLAWIHYERGEADAIEKIQASEHKVADPEFLKALEDPERPVWRSVWSCFNDITSSCFSPDSRHALFGHADGTVRLWDVNSGKELRKFEGQHNRPVWSVCYSPDGRYALSGSSHETVRLWEVDSGKELRRFERRTDDVNSVCFSPDGHYVLSGSWEGGLALLELCSGKELRRFEGHTKGVNSVCFSPDGRYVLSASSDYTTRLWELSNGKELLRLEQRWGSSVAFSPDGRYAFLDGLSLWEVSSGKELRRFEGHTGTVNSVCFSPDGRYVLSGSGDTINGDYTVRLWDVENGKELQRFEGHTNGVRSVCFSPDGRYVLTGTGGGVYLWEVYFPAGNSGVCNLYTSKAKTTLRLREESKEVAELLRVARNSIGEGSYREAYRLLRKAQQVPGYERNPEVQGLLVICGLKGMGERFGLKNAWLLRKIEITDRVRSICFSPDGQYALSATYGEDLTIRLWELSNGKELRSFEGHTGGVNSVCFSPDGRYILSGSQDKTVRLWEMDTGKEIRRFDGHTDAVNSVCSSPDGRYILSGSGFITHEDDTVRLWETGTGKEIRRFDGHIYEVNSVCFSPDGRYILSGNSNLTRVRLWEVGSGKELPGFETVAVNSVCFSPDGRYVLSGGDEKTVRLWEMATRKEIRRFDAHTKAVNSVCFSPDGRYILSGSQDKTVRLWEIESGTELLRFEEHTEWVISVCFSPDGRYALSGSWDNTIKVWEFDWEWEFPESN